MISPTKLVRNFNYVFRAVMRGSLGLEITRVKSEKIIFDILRSLTCLNISIVHRGIVHCYHA
jgi:hypothetical protein